MLPTEESIVGPASLGSASSRKDFRDVRRNHLRLDSLDVLQEADEEAIEMRTVMPVHPEGQEDRSRERGLTTMAMVAPASIVASIEAHGNRFLPLRIASHVHFPSPIMEETIEQFHDEDDDDDDGRLDSSSPPPVVRCKSCEFLAETSSPAAGESRRRRSRSFGDLADLEAHMESEIVRQTNMFCTWSVKGSPRQTLPSDLESISKQEIFSQWKESERQLLNILHNVLREKRQLEQRLLLLQRVVLKPP